ncbi:CPCC family cysteine-rich protein [Streptomyces iconiensis]|uniref:CPCC family cysteine-rich protein n=1 Tax=Streptomyces iconiensis TaxID=1384038 RepID=A0ABT7A1C7_9ACTN|nr:CPCC family cysteine-rich protein [Streptomyces iconiensis]MDJ1135119.1 CPCC family cysteine-rich protein [Streptomyces iconiensis]
MSSYPCPCCGRLVYEAPPGSFQICPVCGWEDDLVQLRWPGASGTNRRPLMEAQLLYREVGITHSEFVPKIRLPGEFWPLEAGFRVIVPEFDDFEPDGVMETEWPEDRTRLYWWRPHFWRRSSRDVDSEA